MYGFSDDVMLLNNNYVNSRYNKRLLEGLNCSKVE